MYFSVSQMVLRGLGVYFILLFAISTQSLATVEWNDTSERIEINMIKYYVDSSSEFSFSDVLQQDIEWVQHSDSTSSSFGFTDSTVWLQFSVRNNASTLERLWFHLDYTLLDYLYVYEYDPRSEENKTPKLIKQMGELAPISEREVDYRQSITELEFAAGQERFFLLKANTSGSLKLPMNLWNKEVFLSYSERNTFLNGAVFGVLLILGLFAFIAGLFLKERSMFFYSLFLLSIGSFLFAYMGYSNHYILYNYRWLNDYVVPISILSAVGWASTFTYSYLEFGDKKKNPLHLSYIVKALVVLSLLFGIICLFVSYSTSIRIAAFYVGFVILLALLLTIYLINREKESSGYEQFYALSWFPVFIGGICLCLNMWNIIPSTFLVDYALLIGLSVQFVILMYGAAYRYYQETREHIETNFEKEKLEEMSIKDSLTKLYNRRYFDSKIKEELYRASRLQQKIGLVLIDIDHFKSVNDTLGHDAGDVCLVKLAQLMQETFRREFDIIARYGGEEFVLLLPHIDKEPLIALVENLRKSVEVTDFFNGEHDRKITISSGATLYEGDRTIDERFIFKVVDDALYHAKGEGRNRTVYTDLNSRYDEFYGKRHGDDHV